MQFEKLIADVRVSGFSTISCNQPIESEEQIGFWLTELRAVRYRTLSHFSKVPSFLSATNAGTSLDNLPHLEVSKEASIVQKKNWLTQIRVSLLRRTSVRSVPSIFVVQCEKLIAMSTPHRGSAARKKIATWN